MDYDDKQIQKDLRNLPHDEKAERDKAISEVMTSQMTADLIWSKASITNLAKYKSELVVTSKTTTQTPLLTSMFIAGYTFTWQNSYKFDTDTDVIMTNYSLISNGTSLIFVNEKLIGVTNGSTSSVLTGLNFTGEIFVMKNEIISVYSSGGSIYASFQGYKY